MEDELILNGYKIESQFELRKNRNELIINAERQGEDDKWITKNEREDYDGHAKISGRTYKLQDGVLVERGALVSGRSVRDARMEFGNIEEENN